MTGRGSRKTATSLPPRKVGEPGSEWFTVHQGDVRKLGQLLEPYSPVDDPLITCTITSPPYANLKNYGHPDQIGWGQPTDEYLAEMRRVFRTLYRYTKHDGSLWLIADSYRSDDGELQPLPFQLAEEAADSGWILRDTIIWQKHMTLPWSSGSRLRNTFEYVLHFVKSRNYKFYLDRLRDPTELTQWWVGWPERYNPHGAVPTNIWDIPIPVQGSWKTPAIAHACPLPPDLIERILMLSTDECDVVLDPFAGTGVVVAEANRKGRRGIGTELNADYVKAFKHQVVPEIGKRSQHDMLAKQEELTRERRDNLIRLRALKYPKVLLQGLANEYPELSEPYAVSVIPTGDWHSALREGNGPLNLELLVAIEGTGADIDVMTHAIKDLGNRPPASKFGIVPDLKVVRRQDFLKNLDGRKQMYLYEAGNTWYHAGRIKVTDSARIRAAGAHVVRGTNYRYAPILSSIGLRIDRPDQGPKEILGS